MRAMRTLCRTLLPVLLLALPAAVQGQFNYTANNGQITITGYTGPGGTVVIPNMLYGVPVTRIGESAFSGCTSLTSVTIPDSVTAIWASAFYQCYKLTTATIGNSVTNIGAFAFCYSGLTSVTIGTNVASIGTDAFCYSALTDVTIPDSVTSIEGGAFMDCSRLTNFTIGSSLTNIGDHPFDACPNLKAITVNALNPAYSSLDGVLFSKNQTTLIQCPATKAGSYTIPNSVTKIGTNAFSSCVGLTSVTIPNSIISVGAGAFGGCTSLINVTIPDSVTSIGGAAFVYCTSLTSITIGANVTKIGRDAFSDCSILRAVFFQGNAPNNEQTAFSNDNNAFVYYLPGTTGWSSTFGGRIALLWNPRAQSIGMRTTGLGFSITGTTDIPIVVEGCTNLASPSWTPLQSCTITNGSINFSDSRWTNYAHRFYHIRSP